MVSQRTSEKNALQRKYIKIILNYISLIFYFFEKKTLSIYRLYKSINIIIIVKNSNYYFIGIIIIFGKEKGYLT